ncbi:hypothetical protein ACWE42_21265 [Sutcliffiella cohnii]
MRYLWIVLCLFLVVACSPKYNDDDVAAVIFGEEVTVKDVRALYGLDGERLPDGMRYYVLEELIAKEAEGYNYDISEYMDYLDHAYPPPDYGGNSEFFEKQADYLGISVEEYYEVYWKERSRRGQIANLHMMGRGDRFLVHGICPPVHSPTILFL